MSVKNTTGHTNITCSYFACNIGGSGECPFVGNRKYAPGGDNQVFMGLVDFGAIHEYVKKNAHAYDGAIAGYILAQAKRLESKGEDLSKYSLVRIRTSDFFSGNAKIIERFELRKTTNE